MILPFYLIGVKSSLFHCGGHLSAVSLADPAIGALLNDFFSLFTGVECSPREIHANESEANFAGDFVFYSTGAFGFYI